ncbi:T132A protein, partial [Grallaria varia]|nr:T132A protein [Grallaria varia]
PPDPVFLPAELEVLGVPEYYRLQRVDQDVPPNSSLHSRSETFLLLRHHAGSRALLQATYPPFSTRQEIPMESPPGSASWAVRAVSLESSVSPAEPVARVLFHLHDWNPQKDWHHRRARDLPCVTLHAHHRGRVARGTCHLQAPLGVCVVELEIPTRWFFPGSQRSRRRDGDTLSPPEPSRTPEPPEAAELRYSIGGPGECGKGEVPRFLGMLELRAGEPERRQEVRLDDKVLLSVPDATLRPGQRFRATVALRSNFTAHALTLRIKAKKGLQVVAAHPAIPGIWSAHLEHSRGPKHSLAVVTCRQIGDTPGPSGRASEPAVFLHVELAVENGTGGPARPLTWQVEYPGQDPESQKDKLVWEIQVAEREIRALVPLAQELEILNTAPLTGIPRVVPVKLVAVEAGGGVAELAEPVGCESADKQVLQVSDSCDVVFVGGRESRGARGARVDFWARRLHAELAFSVWAPLLPLRVHLADPALEQLRGWRRPGNADRCVRFPAGAPRMSPWREGRGRPE